MSHEMIKIASIRRDSGTQSRAMLDQLTVAEYAEAMKDGAQFPPVTLFFDGTDYHLGDGFHRAAAAEMAGLTEIAADVRQGTRRDAVLFSAGANAHHGLRRTNADKERAVRTLLADEEWRQWSDRNIAIKAVVDHKTVGRIRAQMIASGEIPQISGRLVQRGDSTFLMTEPAYPAGPSDNADVEAARQQAIKLLSEYATEDDLRHALKSRVGGGDPDGICYQFGVGYLSDGPESSQSVTAKQIGISMTTPNGTGVFRFDAFNLWQWMQERDAHTEDGDVISTLIKLQDAGSPSYVDGKIAKKLLKYGFAVQDSTKTKFSAITVAGRTLLDEAFKRRPILGIESEIKTDRYFYRRPGDGDRWLSNVYAANANGQFRSDIDSQYGDSNWVEPLVERGLIQSYQRPRAGVKGQSVWLTTITPQGCDLLGRDRLPLLPEPPDAPYHTGANVFITPDARFSIKPGDMVRHKAPQSGTAIVSRLGEWPELYLKGNNWDHLAYETDLELVNRAYTSDGDKPTSVAGSSEPEPAPVAPADIPMHETEAQEDLDYATEYLWDLLNENVSNEINDYPDEAVAEALRPHLNAMKTILAATPSGQRLALAVQDAGLVQANVAIDDEPDEEADNPHYEYDGGSEDPAEAADTGEDDPYGFLETDEAPDSDVVYYDLDDAQPFPEDL